MDSTGLSEFVEKLRTDEALRRRVFAMEEASAKKIFKQIADVNKEQDDELLTLAKEVGIDLSGELKRPGASGGTPAGSDFEEDTCTLTCCLAATSTWRAPVRD